MFSFQLDILFFFPDNVLLLETSVSIPGLYFAQRNELVFQMCYLHITFKKKKKKKKRYVGTKSNWKKTCLKVSSESNGFAFDTLNETNSVPLSMQT